MRKRTSLAARLKKLEQRQFQKPFKLIIIANRDAKDSDIVGITDGNKLHIMRASDEPLAAFERRSAELTQSRCLFHVHAAHGGAERDCEAERHSVPSQA